MNLPRRTPKQDVRCAGCSLAFTERKRKPCPVCGSLNRILVRSADMGDVTVFDRMR